MPETRSAAVPEAAAASRPRAVLEVTVAVPARAALVFGAGALAAVFDGDAEAPAGADLSVFAPGLAVFPVVPPAAAVVVFFLVVLVFVVFFATLLATFPAALPVAARVPPRVDPGA